MIQLFGLMCLVAGDASSCNVHAWEDTFDTMEVCQEVGAAQVGGMTPWGIIVNYKCEAAGEDA